MATRQTKKSIKSKQQLTESALLSSDNKWLVEYRKDLGNMKSGIAQSTGWKKKLILKMAYDLEQAGEIPTSRISRQIIKDLDYEIETEQISPDWIWETLPDTHKDGSYRKRGSKGGKAKSLKDRMKDWQDNVVNETSEVLQHWTGLDAKEIIRTPGDVIISSTDTFRRRLIMLWSDEEVTFARQVLSVGVPVLADTLHIVEEEFQNRRNKAKLLSR